MSVDEASKVFKEKVIEEGPWNDEGDANSMWEKMATCVRKVASEVLGVTKGSGCYQKDTQWWNEDVQKAIKKKKECYKRLYPVRCANNIEKYKVAKKTVKRAVSEAKGHSSHPCSLNTSTTYKS